MKRLHPDFLIDEEKLEITYKDALSACFEEDKKYIRGIVEDIFDETANDLYKNFADKISNETGVSRIIHSEIVIPVRRIRICGRVTVDKKWRHVPTPQLLQIQG